MRIGHMVPVPGGYRQMPESAVWQMQHRPYGDLVIEREDDDAGTVQ